VGGILAFWEALSEQKKAALFALVCWLVFGLYIRIWED
jgi:hypothetical protein